MLIDWEHYPPDTWAGEAGEHLFLIKSLDDASFYYVFGTVDEVMITGEADELSHAQAIANRWAWLVNNVTPDQVVALLSKL